MTLQLSYITLGVADLARAARFYGQALGLERLKANDELVFFALGSVRLALYRRTLLVADAGIDGSGDGFGGSALSVNVASAAAVEQLLQRVPRYGGQRVKAASCLPWGGYRGYFTDPDGFLWEAAWHPDYAFHAEE